MASHCAAMIELLSCRRGFSRLLPPLERDPEPFDPYECRDRFSPAPEADLRLPRGRWLIPPSPRSWEVNIPSLGWAG